MTNTNIIQIAMAHFDEMQSKPIKTITIDEWKDDKGKPLAFNVYSLTADDIEAISHAKREHGRIGAICVRIIRSCYVAGGAEKLRAFADTDLSNMMKSVDLSIIERINNEIEA